MKKLTTTFILLLANLVLITTSFAQSPEAFSYQAIIRDGVSNLVTSHTVSMQISIIQGSIEGTAVYVERQFPTTNINGLASLEIGDGNQMSGDFSTIDWSDGPYFIKTETDIAGGTNYTIVSASELLSVPYALHATTAESITGEITETDPTYTAWDKSTGIEITENQISDLQSYLTEESDPEFNTSVAAGITEEDTASWNDNSGYVVTTYAIGDTAQGGVVFYVSPSGLHGLVVATQLQSASTESWYTAFNDVSDTSNYDALAKEYTDWRLPNIFELGLFDDQVDVLGWSVGGTYWSSTEVTETEAEGYMFIINDSFTSVKTGTGWKVQAIRSF